MLEFKAGGSPYSPRPEWYQKSSTPSCTTHSGLRVMPPVHVQTEEELRLIHKALSYRNHPDPKVREAFEDLASYDHEPYEIIAGCQMVLRFSPRSS